MNSKERLFGRKMAKANEQAQFLMRKRMQAAAKLCETPDFKVWLFDVLDDLSGFARDEGMLTDFGQGIRAAAARIQERLLIVPEAIDLLADLHKNALRADYERFAVAYNQKKDNN